ncbi:MAG: hypothetical protein ACE10C_10145 [Candidatus Binatia bacterium]
MGPPDMLRGLQTLDERGVWGEIKDVRPDRELGSWFLIVHPEREVR